MATTQLADIYNPLTFSRRAQESQIELNRFLASGVAIADPIIANQIAAGGHQGDMTGMGPLTKTEPNYGNDDPNQHSTPDKISKQTQRFRAAARNKSWSVMDLARDLALVDPVAAITGRIGAYWATDDERRIIQSFLGVLASNVNDYSADMVVDVSTDAASAPAAPELVSGNAVIDALQTLGDHKESIGTIAVHSVVQTTLQKLNLIQWIAAPNNASILIPTYLGKRLIVDDSLPAVSGSNRVKYTSILFGAGVVGTANGRVNRPSAIVRSETAGMGAGEESIFSRVNNVWHPYGFSFSGDVITPGSLFATYADLADAANWSRIVNRKNVPVAFLVTNG